MTVASEVSSVSHAGNGATKTFAVPFIFYDVTDLAPVLISSSGEEIPVGSFSINGAGQPTGGSITLGIAPPAGYTLRIDRDPPKIQLTAYTDRGRFPASSHERALDRNVMMAQAVDRKRARVEGRTLRVRTGASIDPIDPVSVGGKFLYATSPTTVQWVTHDEARALIGALPDGTLPGAPMTGPALPEGVVAAVPGYPYVRSGVAADISVFYKQTGSGVTGWRQVLTSPYLDLKGDGTDETAKVTGKPEQLISGGRTVTVSAIPPISSPDTLWRVPNVEGANTMSGVYPSNPSLLPATVSRLMPPLSYATWSEDTAHMIDGVAHTFVHPQSGGHGTSEPGCIVLCKENLSTGEVTHELLWRPDPTSPLGYMTAAAWAIDHTQFVMVSPRTGDRTWKLYRRNIGHYKEAKNVISSTVGTTVARFVKSVFPWGAYVGMKFQFLAAPSAVGGLTFDTSTVYRVSQVTTSEVRFVPDVAGAFPAASSTVSLAGGYISLKAAGTAFEEVKFVGNLSWGAAVKAITGLSSEPGYPLGNGVNTRTNNAGIAAVGTSTIVLMDSLLRSAPDYAVIAQVRDTPNRPKNEADVYYAGGGPSFAFYDDGTTNGVWVGVFQARDFATARPIVFISRDAFATEPSYVLLPTASVNCRIPCIVTKNYGRGARFQFVAPTRRDPGGDYKRLDFFVWDVKIDDFLAAPTSAAAAALIQRYAIGKVDYYGHNAAELGDGPAVNGMGSMVEMPGGGGFYAPTPYQPPLPAFASKNLAGHMAFKVDTRYLTGCTSQPPMAAGAPTYPPQVIASFTGMVAGGAGTNLKFQAARYDWTLGNYDPSTGHYEAREHCRLRFDFATPIAVDDSIFYVSVYDVTAGAEYVEPYGDGVVPYTAYARQSGGVCIARGSVDVSLVPGQKITLRVMSGATIATGGSAPLSRLAWLRIERLA